MVGWLDRMGLHVDRCSIAGSSVDVVLMLDWLGDVVVAASVGAHAPNI